MDILLRRIQTKWENKDFAKSHLQALEASVKDPDHNSVQLYVQTYEDSNKHNLCDGDLIIGFWVEGSDSIVDIDFYAEETFVSQHQSVFPLEPRLIIDNMMIYPRIASAYSVPSLCIRSGNPTPSIKFHVVYAFLNSSIHRHLVAKSMNIVSLKSPMRVLVLHYGSAYLVDVEDINEIIKEHITRRQANSGILFFDRLP